MIEETKMFFVYFKRFHPVRKVKISIDVSMVIAYQISSNVMVEIGVGIIVKISLVVKDLSRENQKTINVTYVYLLRIIIVIFSESFLLDQPLLKISIDWDWSME